MTTRRKTPSILTALNASLKVAEPDTKDQAAVALAKRYALKLDESAVISRAVARSLAKLARIEGCGDLHDELTALAVRIEETHVAAVVGPKLLAALTELQLTPAARRTVTQGGGGGNAGPSALDQLRARRENRATSVDSTS
jgi:hypothetical protein